MNGKYIQHPKNNKKNCHIEATGEPVDNQPENPIGVVHGKLTPVVLGIIPHNVARYDRIKFIIGTKINGIAIIGFNTIGKPKIIGSLIPNIPGTILNFLIV